ncbi:MAG: hypothetical protein KGI66_00455 [Patescibacteria group bacterium]|nr:hypothetical protein [Patescibacteria group bacterium]
MSEILGEGQALARAHGMVSRAEVQMHLKVAESTALNYLETLEKQGRMIRQNKGVDSVYRLTA